MFELTINNQVYPLKFGIGFMREINKRVKEPMKNGKEKDVGLRYAVAGIVDGEVDTIIDVIDIANKGMEPRVTRAEIESYIEDENTDIDKLFEDVLSFFENANCTRRITSDILENVKKYKKQQEQNQS